MASDVPTFTIEAEEEKTTPKKEAMEAILKKWWELRSLKDEFDKLDEWKRKTFRMVDYIKIGEFVITGGWVVTPPRQVRGAKHWEVKIRRVR